MHDNPYASGTSRYDAADREVEQPREDDDGPHRELDHERREPGKIEAIEQCLYEDRANQHEGRPADSTVRAVPPMTAAAIAWSSSP